MDLHSRGGAKPEGATGESGVTGWVLGSGDEVVRGIEGDFCLFVYTWLENLSMGLGKHESGNAGRYEMLRDLYKILVGMKRNARRRLHDNLFELFKQPDHKI